MLIQTIIKPTLEVKWYKLTLLEPKHRDKTTKKLQTYGCQSFRCSQIREEPDFSAKKSVKHHHSMSL